MKKLISTVIKGVALLVIPALVCTGCGKDGVTPQKQQQSLKATNVSAIQYNWFISKVTVQTSPTDATAMQSVSNPVFPTSLNGYYNEWLPGHKYAFFTFNGFYDIDYPGGEDGQWSLADDGITLTVTDNSYLSAPFTLKVVGSTITSSGMELYLSFGGAVTVTDGPKQITAYGMDIFFTY